MRDWRVGFYTYMLLTNFTLGIYLVISRDLVKTELGYDYRFMTSLIAASNIPLLFSIFAGALGDVLGRKNLVLLGALASLPIYFMGVLGLDYFPLLTATYMTLWAFASPSVTGSFLDATASSGLQYSLYSMFGAAGWGLGGLLAGYLRNLIGVASVFTLAALAIAAAFAIAFLTYPKERTSEGAKATDVIYGVKTSLSLFIVISLLMISINLFYGNYALRLREIAGSPEMFGLVYTALPATMGVIVRPLAGRLSDKFSPKAMLVASLTGYAILFPLMNFSYGLLAIILWLIPLYPFQDQGSMMLLSRSLRLSLQGVAAGMLYTASSLSGLVVLLASGSPLVKDMNTITTFSEACALAGIAILLSRVKYEHSIMKLS